MTNFNVPQSSVAMLIVMTNVMTNILLSKPVHCIGYYNDVYVYCNDKYSIVKTRPLCIVMTNILLSKPVHCILVVTDYRVNLCTSRGGCYV